MSYREHIAMDKGIDNTLSLLTEGYLYISNRTKRYNRNMFETRLLGGKKCVCMVGKEAAELFYDRQKFNRHGATPPRVVRTLFGQGGVQTLDGAAHHNRKELFMSLMSQERLAEIAEIVKQEWQHALGKWNKKDKIVLYEEAQKLLTVAACRWAGVPRAYIQKEGMTAQLASLFEAGGAIGAKHWRGRINRKRAEDWVEGLIIAVRQDRITVNQEAALCKMAFHRDLFGERLHPRIAAVELINIIRPIVAISVYIAFCALALHEFPAAHASLKSGTPNDYHIFVQEVRRYYPFFPMIMAKVRDDFLWNGHDFRKGTLAILDLYGTNHDPSLWKNPHAFWPGRFKDREENAFDLIPQGGGDHYKGHRCPGEWLTIRVMETCTEMLVQQMTYDVPAQNLDFSMTRMPSIPKSGFVMDCRGKKRGSFL